MKKNYDSGKHCQHDNLIKQRLQKPLDSTTKEYYIFVKQTFFQELNLLLFSLLNRTYNAIKLEKDAQILYGKNMELSAKLYLITGAESINLFSETLASKEREFRSMIKEKKKYKDDMDFELNQVSLKLFDDIFEFTRSNASE